MRYVKKWDGAPGGRPTGSWRPSALTIIKTTKKIDEVIYLSLYQGRWLKIVWATYVISI